MIRPPSESFLQSQGYLFRFFDICLFPSLSFFAVPDSALPHHKHEVALNEFPPVFADDIYETPYLPGPTNLQEALRLLEDLNFSSKSVTDEKDHEKRKKVLKIILRAILEYHIIPTAAYDIITLGHNSTYPTSLVVPGILGSQPQRLRVKQAIIPSLTFINFYVKVIRPNVKASNGKITLILSLLLFCLFFFLEVLTIFS